MHERAIRRAAAFAAAALLLTTAVAAADTVPADGDEVSPGIQDFFEIGPIGTGGTFTAAIGFDLECNTASHVDPGQTVFIAFGTPDVPEAGGATGTGTTIGPVGEGWPADGALCPAGTAPIHSSAPASVTLTAPPVPGVYEYIVNFTRSLSPAGADDGAALRGPTRVFFEMTVVPDSEPTLAVPAALTVEGDTIGGAIVEYAVSATDAEDPVPPTPSCTPASGSFFALGDTEVGCTATDTAGHVASASFTVSVVDTTAPVLTGLPGSLSLAADQPSGTAAVYLLPTATDVVDPSPVVSCSPAPGSPLPVGTTTGTCQAEDASHNVTTASFAIVVTYAPASPVLEATFEEPVGAGGVLIGNAGRTLPVKVRLVRDGRPVTDGAVELTLTGCAGGAAIGSPVALRWQAERWQVGLATEGLVGCFRATVSVDGNAAGGFEARLGAPAADLRAKAARR